MLLRVNIVPFLEKPYVISALIQVKGLKTLKSYSGIKPKKWQLSCLENESFFFHHDFTVRSTTTTDKRL